MTRTEPLPRHTPNRLVGDHTRRATIAEAALGVDAYAPLDWLAGSGASTADALIAWADGKLTDVPAGHAWDVVRMPTTPGWDAIRHLRAMGAEVGPVLHTLRGVEVFVPLGSAADWDLPGATLVAGGEIVGCPHPAVVPPYTRNGASWVVSPRAEPVLTNAADLYGAYAAALVTLGQPVEAA